MTEIIARILSALIVAVGLGSSVPCQAAVSLPDSLSLEHGVAGQIVLAQAEEADVDDGAADNVDDGDVGNVDDSDVDNVDDGDVDNVDDGDVDDVDDGDVGNGDN
jgi:hypothetical protein